MHRKTRADAMWLAENWESDVARCYFSETHPTRIRQAYNEWLAEEWDSIFRNPENRTYTNPGNIRHDAMWLAENWDSGVGLSHTGETHPTVIRRAYNKWLKSKPLFGNWVKENGFGDIPREYRLSAMWMHENWGSLLTAKLSVTDPIKIHQAYREWLKSQEDSMWWADAGFTAKTFCSSEVRSNAMWLAENWDAGVQRLHTTESHPTNIRRAYNEWLKSQEDSKASHAFIVGKLMLMAQELPWN